MAMLLVVATKEATDPTRECGPFSSAANVSELSSKRVRGETRGVTEEVRVGEILSTSHHQNGSRQTDGTDRVHIFRRRR
jgi:hypothetical protein